MPIYFARPETDLLGMLVHALRTSLPDVNQAHINPLMVVPSVQLVGGGAALCTEHAEYNI